MIEVHVGNDLASNGNSNTLCGTATKILSGTSHVFNCKTPLEGQYINVNTPEHAQLRICEVEAYGPGALMNVDPQQKLTLTATKARHQVEQDADKEQKTAVLSALAEDIKDQKVALKLAEANELEQTTVSKAKQRRKV